MPQPKVRDVTEMDITLKQQLRLDGRFYLLDQRHDNLQCFFCCLCEGANSYSLSECDPNFTVPNKRGSIRENSDCLTRILCVCNRPFQAMMKLHGEDFAYIQRPLKCCLQWLPCAQNQMTVKNATGRILGLLKIGTWCMHGAVYDCADAVMQIYDGQTSQILFTIEGSYCQKSIMFPCCRCCYCPTVDYHIYDRLNFRVGKIMNLYNGCLRECFSRTSKFGVEMPLKAEQEHRVLLIFAALYLDYLRYDTPYFCLGFR